MALSWVYVSLPWATFALGIDAAGVVRMAPPIAHWTVGKGELLVARHYRRAGAVFIRIEEHVGRRAETA